MRISQNPGNGLPDLRVGLEIIVASKGIPPGHCGPVVRVSSLDPIFDAVSKDRFAINNDRSQRGRDAIDGQSILIIFRWSHNSGGSIGGISVLGSRGNPGNSKRCTTKRYRRQGGQKSMSQRCVLYSRRSPCAICVSSTLGKPVFPTHQKSSKPVDIARGAPPYRSAEANSFEPLTVVCERGDRYWQIPERSRRTR